MRPLHSLSLTFLLAISFLVISCSDKVGFRATSALDSQVFPSSTQSGTLDQTVTQMAPESDSNISSNVVPTPTPVSDFLPTPTPTPSPTPSPTPVAEPTFSVNIVRACAMAFRDYKYVPEHPEQSYDHAHFLLVELDKGLHLAWSWFNTSHDANILFEASLPAGPLAKGTSISIPNSTLQNIPDTKKVVAMVCDSASPVTLGSTELTSGTGSRMVLGNMNCLPTRWENVVNLPQSENSVNQSVYVYQKRVDLERWVPTDPQCDQLVASPLVLDLDGDGISLSGPSVSFDLDGDGHAVQTGWVTSDRDAFLALPDENGQVTSGLELFGNATLLPDGTRARNGFEALAQYDMNHDGVIDESDPIYSRLRLWRDTNLNAICEPGELHSLAEEGVLSIDLHYVAMSETDAFGNETQQRAIFKRQVNGILSQSLIVDIWFHIIP